MEVLTNCRCTNIAPVYRNRAAGIEVYTAKHPTFGDIAIKILDCSSEASLQFYQKEGRIAQALEHPSICRVFEQSYVQTMSGYKFYIIMEKATNDLYNEIKKRMQGHRPWSEGCVLNMLEQTVSALAHAQQEGVCHRDIKPQNILIWQDGRLKLADFGSANEEIRNSEVQTLTLQGTPMYLSPELREFFVLPEHQRPRKPRYNPYKSDVYSLALTCIHFIQLFPAMDLTRLENLPETTKRRVEELQVSPVLKEILMSMLSCDEDMRPDFNALKQILDDMLNGGLEKKFVEPVPDNYLLAPGEEVKARQEYVPAQVVAPLPGLVPSLSTDFLSPPSMFLPVAPPNSVFNVSEENKQQPAVQFTVEERAPSMRPARPNALGFARANILLQETTSLQSEHSIHVQSGIVIQPSIHESYHHPSEPQEPDVGQEPPGAQRCVICCSELDDPAMEFPCGHRFCAIDCLEVLMLDRLKYFRRNLAELLCPVEFCRHPISPEYIQTLKFEGMTIRTYTRSKQSEEICMECKHAKELRTLECTHKFCDKCMSGWIIMAQRTNAPLIKCSICRKSLADQDSDYIVSIVNKPENLK